MSHRPASQRIALALWIRFAILALANGSGSSVAIAGIPTTTYPGKTVLACWHHDHMKELVKALGVEGSIPDWSMFTFNKIWIVSLSGDRTGTLRIETQWGSQPCP